MSTTTILPTDPLKRKAWSAKVAADSIKTQYFARMEGEEGTNSAVVRKTDLEAGRGQNGQGDEVVTALVAKLRGTPIIEGKKLAGAEMKLSNAAHTMRINEFRHGVNVGSRITQTRIGYNLRAQGREKLTDYISEMYEEIIAMAANGARGVGDEIQQFPVGWVGYPNSFRTPDAAHYFCGPTNAATKATLTQADVLSLKTLNKLSTKAKKMLGGQPDKSVKIQKVNKAGKDCYILAVAPEVMQDIRDDSGAQGWFEAQRALTAAIGKESEIFKGGAGMFNGVLVDEMETCVKFNDFGASGSLPAVRSLFLGANAICVAHGTKGMADGMSVALSEDTDDRGHEAVLDFELIFGADKSQFNGQDYGMMTIDSAFTAAA